MESDDPTVLRVLAVTTDDIVTAIEANERRDVGAVLRVTPPFSGRMRARLHREGTEHGYDDPSPIHVPPARFVDSVPPFPSPDDTEDEIRADPETAYSRESHRRRHETAVEAWRTRVRESIRESVSIRTSEGPHEVRLALLG
ncbi:MAG: hypothetical protein ACQET5_04020 [Halobacteriota archaeon]|uniref:hypothetical protein n=1 Tax=Natronomonas sp. TaxID=2184060 RepID=UPI00397638FF